MFMNIDKLISEMTLEEKASLLSGLDFWHTKPIDRLSIDKIMVSDGPHGLRKEKEGERGSIEATCFPTASSLACSFDRSLLEELGKALGSECIAENVSVILGPGANIKRTPLCGRNFEYFSEDPYLSGEMAASHIKGVQSMGVGTSLKHFACNNQEYRRMSVSAQIDERTLREIYLASFEIAVKKAKPQTLMCSYNKINGEYSSQNKKLLTDILRDEWGFNGLVMSDWGAVDDRVKGVAAGLDLEMPASGGKNDNIVIEAVKSGKLDEKYVDICARRVLELVDKHCDAKAPVSWDKEKDHELAGKIESECMVLLKNDGVLPLKADESIAFIGEFAENPRYQGGGSSHINSYKVTSAVDAVKDICEVSFARGYVTDKDETDKSLLAQAVEAASKCDKAVLFVGLPESFESEGFDRKHLRMPDCQLELIDEVCKVNKNVVIVLHNGAPIEMPFADKVSAILEGYLGGEAVGKAQIDVLFGKINPSGKLAETFPRKLSDNPSYLNYPGEGDIVKYNEGIFVGYRYYDKKEIEPLFPFGFGLSYTTFEYSDIEVSHDELDEDQILTVRVSVKNTGSVAGKEVVELYVRDTESSVIRPDKELKGFEKTYLLPGETKQVVFKLDKRAFAYFDTSIMDWHIEYGKFEILVGSSSRDIKLSKSVYVAPKEEIPHRYTLNSLCCDVFANPLGKKLLYKALGLGKKGSKEEQAVEDFKILALGEMPLHSLVSFIPNDKISRATLSELVDILNAEA
ncbi:MAG: glycoside hydrolase family 3 C-terminal domain-containing protein [Ruminococcus sp.]|nr:glycoside hydrolase family 3 C-terminal domain-containing protein [Ruminococcus sp.]